MQDNTDGQYDIFKNARASFMTEVVNLLIINSPRNTKYIKVYDSGSIRYGHVYVYLQRQTNNIVQIVINGDISVDQYGKEPVVIYATDKTIHLQLERSDCVREMRESIIECREGTRQDQIVTTLTYNSIPISKNK